MNTIFVYNNQYQTLDNSSTFQALFNWCKQNFASAHVEIEEINSDTLFKLESANALAMFMPGGKSTNYQKNLSQDKVSIIDKFVENGGFLSVCCGSTYWLAREIFFDTKQEKIQAQNSSKFTFFDSLKGPLNDMAKPFEESPTILDIDIGNQFINIPTYYHGGPRINLQKNMNAIANFSNTDIPAIVSTRYGSGFIYAASPHIECTKKALASCENVLNYYSLMPDDLDKKIVHYIYNELYLDILNKQTMAY